MSDAFVAIEFDPNQVLTSTEMNQMADNQANLHNGTALADDCLASRHLSAASVTPAKLSDQDWLKKIPAFAMSSVVAGSWTQDATSGTGSIAGHVAQLSDGSQNTEGQYKIVLAAGTYKMYLHHDRDINRGIYTISVDGTAINTVDAYAATRVVAVLSTVTTALTISTSKLVTVNIKMASKNASSSAYYANFYEIVFARTA